MAKSRQAPSHRLRIMRRSSGVSYDWVRLVETYGEYVKEDFVVLEIGAASVHKTKELAGACRKLIGLELISEQVPDDFENMTFLQGDWLELSNAIGPESIDIVVAHHVIEHVEDDTRAIAETYEALKPNGVALIVTPNRKRLTRAIIDVFTGERHFPRQIVMTTDLRNWAGKNIGTMIPPDQPLGDVRYVVEHQREYTEQDLTALVRESAFVKSEIVPVVLGLHGGPLFVFLDVVPKRWRRYANYWMLILTK